MNHNMSIYSKLNPKLIDFLTCTQSIITLGPMLIGYYISNTEKYGFYFSVFLNSS